MQSSPIVEIVSATRMTEEEFWDSAALGQSLRRLADDSRLITHITYDNKVGLPQLYNRRIAATNAHQYLVFIHDDVWIDDFYFVDRIIEGCSEFDIIGVAGNRRRMPNEISWLLMNADSTWDDAANLSGRVAHGTGPFGAITYYGPAPCDCELLDGVFLAARKSSLVAKQVIFDPAFNFHFYDLDFCRTARESGLRMGTWPISLTHQSGGNFFSEGWQQTLREYASKWHE